MTSKKQKKSKHTKRTKKMNTLDKYVISVFIYFFLFVITAWITFWIFGSVPDTLIQYGLGGGAVELAMAAAIKIFKRKNGVEDKSSEEDDMTEG